MTALTTGTPAAARPANLPSSPLPDVKTNSATTPPDRSDPQKLREQLEAQQDHNRRMELLLQELRDRAARQPPPRSETKVRGRRISEVRQ